MFEDPLVYVKSKLAEIKPRDFDVVADGSSVPLATIRKIHYGESKNPRNRTVVALATYFHSKRKLKKAA